jgi:hypothetical protein
MPGNATYGGRYEVAKLAQALLPRWTAAGLISMLAFALVALNIVQVRRGGGATMAVPGGG